MSMDALSLAGMICLCVWSVEVVVFLVAYKLGAGSRQRIL